MTVYARAEDVRFQGDKKKCRVVFGKVTEKTVQVLR